MVQRLPEAAAAMKVIYKIIYPNGKIHVGMDLTDNIRYFGSADPAMIAADFPDRDARRNFSVSREILWESATASDAEVRAKEVEFIRRLRANDPGIGYNKWPRYSRSSDHCLESTQVANFARDCPFCAYGDLAVVVVESDTPTLAVRCPECGATGPRSVSDDPAHAIFAWNQREGRLTVVR